MGKKRDPHMVTGVRGAKEPPGSGPGAEAGDTVLLSIPSKPEYVALCRLAVAGLARVSDLPEETVADLKLAVTEACTFALQHAEEHQDAYLEVGFRLTPRSWVIDVAWPRAGQQPGAPLVDGSLGLAVMRALVDDVDSGLSSGGHAQLRLTKQT